MNANAAEEYQKKLVHYNKVKGSIFMVIGLFILTSAAIDFLLVHLWGADPWNSVWNFFGAIMGSLQLWFGFDLVFKPLPPHFSYISNP